LSSRAGFAWRIETTTKKILITRVHLIFVGFDKVDEHRLFHQRIIHETGEH
jgi:hypothetical protein